MELLQSRSPGTWVGSWPPSPGTHQGAGHQHRQGPAVLSSSKETEWGHRYPAPTMCPVPFLLSALGGPLLCHLPGLLLLPCSPWLPDLPCTPSGCLCSRTAHRVEDQLITLSLAALVGKAGSLMCVLQRPRSWTSYRLASEDRAWLECSCGMQACRPAPPPPPPPPPAPLLLLLLWLLYPLAGM